MKNHTQSVGIAILIGVLISLCFVSSLQAQSCYGEPTRLSQTLSPEEAKKYPGWQDKIIPLFFTLRVQVKKIPPEIIKKRQMEAGFPLSPKEEHQGKFQKNLDSEHLLFIHGMAGVPDGTRLAGRLQPNVGIPQNFLQLFVHASQFSGVLPTHRLLTPGIYIFSLSVDKLPDPKTLPKSEQDGLKNKILFPVFFRPFRIEEIPSPDDNKKQKKLKKELDASQRELQDLLNRLTRLLTLGRSLSKNNEDQNPVAPKNLKHGKVEEPREEVTQQKIKANGLSKFWSEFFTLLPPGKIQKVLSLRDQVEKAIQVPLALDSLQQLPVQEDNLQQIAELLRAQNTADLRESFFAPAIELLKEMVSPLQTLQDLATLEVQTPGLYSLFETVEEVYQLIMYSAFITQNYLQGGLAGEDFSKIVKEWKSYWPPKVDQWESLIKAYKGRLPKAFFPKTIEIIERRGFFSDLKQWERFNEGMLEGRYKPSDLDVFSQQVFLNTLALREELSHLIRLEKP